ncbi:GNAT family N-acetyltransferase [Alteromonas aestuariivivens]|uniref:GNAT family N-acetyltransferase n=1 Tax=Alteromonas aestuariivivens TaxID=1938339 RepID=A0A3D8M3T3_9ALTE|nr:GNAT family N-acetyltransferase/peptidase C39 family protein [Alteromonas aestuariivivens]RDV24250.1 GNAT family N-acetyltransferase [Alteromonas aestuariivivens]
MKPSPFSGSAVLRIACLDDVSALNALEQRCFNSDRLSKRRFRYYVDAGHAELVVACIADELVGYGLLLSRRGTLLTRLYSIAVDPERRGMGIAENLLRELEGRALARGKRVMRLEVAQGNAAAIRLYERLGFSPFGMYLEYYEDKSNALRMQKVLSFSSDTLRQDVYPWYRQTTEFTCGPAALMMAMTALKPQYSMNQLNELAIWRRATTIFMTSGHGGCHPIGLALAAKDAGFNAEVWLNQPVPLFLDGVRAAHKKSVLGAVENQFAQEAQTQGVRIVEEDWKVDRLEQALQQGAAVICLISTYAFDRRKAPHWVAITGADAHCLYLHDPDPELAESPPVEYQHIPVARDDFQRLANYGKRKIRAAVALYS